MTSPYTALKVVYNRKTRQYDLEVVQNTDLHMIHSGYFVYETANAPSALDMVKTGRCLSMWKEKSRAMVMDFLANS
jgi:hypothetical protein